MAGTTRTSDRARGWLRYLHRKAHTPDNWDKGGQPLEWWDDRSTPPMLNFCRFDLLDSSYALALMADRTPAWREVYAAVLDQLVQRHTTYHSAIDWLTQIGDDPRRASYPEEYRGLIPAEHWGNYNVPGWTANGIEPWGLQMDPIGADGNLFYKGFLLLVLGLHRYVSGDDKWNQPFDMVRDGENTFTWSYSGIAQHLADQWRGRPEGCHCENTKIWPYCLSGAGLGLMMHDVLFGTKHHDVFDTWWEYASEHYMKFAANGDPEWVALYYDPIIDHVHSGGPMGGVLTALYLSPQRRDISYRFYDFVARILGLRDPNREIPVLPDRRGNAIGYALATEFGDDAARKRINELADRAFEPTWTDGEFTWGFGLNEPHPRGQMNATMMVGEAGSEGAWWRIFNEPNLKKFEQPTVVGVDFPAVAMSEAYYDEATRTLQLTMEIADDAPRGSDTWFRIQNMRGPQRSKITCDGSEFTNWWTLPNGEIQIATDLNAHAFRIVEGAAS
jgi:hypothetical protein